MYMKFINIYILNIHAFLTKIWILSKARFDFHHSPLRNLREKKTRRDTMRRDATPACLLRRFRKIPGDISVATIELVSVVMSAAVKRIPRAARRASRETAAVHPPVLFSTLGT